MRWLALALTACAVEHPVQLEIDTGAPISCIEPTPDGPRELPLRAFEPEHIDEDVMFVFDFVTTPSFPRCEPSTIAAECAATGCEAVPEARACLRVPRERLAMLTREDLDTVWLSDFVEGMPMLLADGPDGTLVVRLTIVLEGDDSPCPPEGEVATSIEPFDRERLLGCGYSCPVILSEESIIEIDLDPVLDGEVCTDVFVETCAQIGIDP
jgi:hypothetical protein